CDLDNTHTTWGPVAVGSVGQVYSRKIRWGRLLAGFGGLHATIEYDPAVPGGRQLYGALARWLRGRRRGCWRRGRYLLYPARSRVGRPRHGRACGDRHQPGVWRAQNPADEIAGRARGRWGEGGNPARG